MSSVALLRERVKFAVASGGATSTFWWLLNKITGVEAHHVFCRPLVAIGSVDRLTKNAYSLNSVYSRSEEMKLDSFIRDQLEQHLAEGLAQLSSKGVEVFFLTSDRTVVSQLMICPGPHVFLDTPARVSLHIGSERAFLSYLHTRADHRRTGAAKCLLELVCSELASRGYSELIAHVRTTNVPSLNAFRRGRWNQIGTIWTPRSGGWLKSSKLSKRGITAALALK